MSLDNIITLQQSRMKIFDYSVEEDSLSAVFQNFEGNPSYREVTFNGETIGVHIIDNQTSTQDGTIDRYMISKPPVAFKIGDMIVDDKGDHWICVLVNNLQYNKVLIVPCNNTLTFQTPDTTVHTISCIITDRASVYSDGVEDTKYIRLPDGLIKIVIPNNELTNTFDLLNKRIIFDHSKYSIFEVTKADKLLKKGLIEIIAEVQGYDENKDNLELNLSSYIKPIEEPTEPTDPVVLTITGVDRISVYDTPQTFTVNTDLEVVWSIVGTTAKIQSVDGNSCVVTHVNSMDFGSNILRVELVSDNAVFAEKPVEIVFM